MPYDRQLARLPFDLSKRKVSAAALADEYAENEKQANGAQAIVPDTRFRERLPSALKWMVDQGYLVEEFDRAKNEWVYTAADPQPPSPPAGTIREFVRPS